MAKLIIERIPTSVPPVECNYDDGEEATFRVWRDDDTPRVICDSHMRKYLMDVLESIP